MTQKPATSITKWRSIVVVGLMLGLAGCANMNATEQRTVTGAAGGAAGGALIGAIAGNAGLGAGLGAVVGGAGGYIWDQHKKAEARSYQQGYQAGQTSKSP